MANIRTHEQTVIALIKDLSDATDEANEAYMLWIQKLRRMRETSEKLQAAIDDQLSKPMITLDGLEIDG